MSTDIVAALANTERQIVAALLENAAIQREMEVWLEPSIERGYAEIDRLRRKLADGKNTDLDQARAELAAVYRSQSWRLTTPLRWANAWIFGRRQPWDRL